MTTPPLIGISGRRWPATKIVSLEPRYQVRSFDFGFADFSKNVAAAGGIPITIPYDAPPELILDRLDGLVLTGGEDIVPGRWGGDPADVVGDVSAERDAYETALFAAALRWQRPVLGVCRGMQVINVARGGSLIGDLTRDGREHRNPGAPVDDLAHRVDFDVDSLAHRIYGPSTMVNSLHHQACDRPGDGIVVSGRAPDGVIEALEIPDLRVVGVQWHPEWMPTPDPIFAWLVESASIADTTRNQPHDTNFDTSEVQ